ncbi:MAG: hypothetical protein R2748_14480 [Bryobacterales bacterium]
MSDTEALRRPLGGYYRDRFAQLDPEPRELSVLMVSPYGIEPPIHGGAVFMNQTARHLAKALPAASLLHGRRGARAGLEPSARSGLRIGGARVAAKQRCARGRCDAAVRGAAVLEPRAQWRLHRALYLSQADVLQVEYTQLACYRPAFDRIATVLFEHDVYFQSVARSLGRVPQTSLKAAYAFEYLRALRFERRALRGFDAVQVCTRANREYLESFAWNAPPIEGYRAGIDVSRYAFTAENREPDTLLFVGNQAPAEPGGARVVRAGSV